MRFLQRLAAFTMLGFASMPAHAHGIPVWMFVAALSPLPVLMFVVLDGWLARNWRGAAVHAALLAVWVAWFWLASNVHEVRLLGIPTDYVIWAALVLYVMHVLVIAWLVVVHAVRRIRGRKDARWN